MRKEYLKRVGSLALSAAMVFTTVMPAMAAEPEQQITEEAATVWTLGQKEDVNGPEDGKQGTNGWYFLYSDDIDVAEGTNYDVSKFKECTWADKGSLQFKSEGGSYDSMWVPANYLKEGLTGNALIQPNWDNPDSTFNNWVMTSNGTLNPNVETTAVTGIYAWAAPTDGEYNYEVGYEAGGDHCDLGGTRYYYHKDYYIKDGTADKKTPEQREGGVAVSVNTKDSKKAYEQCIAKTVDHDYLYSGTFTGTVNLTAGEKIYFAVDPREVGTYDMANLRITITTAQECVWSDEPVYTWDEESHVCTAKRTCATHKGHTSFVTAEGKLVEGAAYTEPTCTKDGEGTFEAVFEDKTLEKQTKVLPIKKLEHDYSDSWADYADNKKAKFVWADDFSKCTWTTPCKNCGEYGVVEESTQISTTPITQTCTEGGTFVYNASFYWGWVWATSEEQTATEGLGHDFTDARYEWTSDKTMCTKYKVCSRCDAEEEGDTVQATITEPDCTTEGKASASFDEGKDIAEEKIPALGHKWGEWEKVSGATTSKPEIQKRVCSVCNDEETREVGSVLPTKVTKLAISGISKKIAAGKKIQLAAAATPANATDKTVTWTSSNKKYATVTANGVVKTKKAGKGKTVTITATAKDGSGVKAVYKIKIMKNAVKSISLKAKAKTVKAGKKTTVKATVKTTGKSSVNKTLKWTSSNTKYATVTSKGVVKTKKAGKGRTVKITAKATDGSNRSKTIKIKIK